MSRLSERHKKRKSEDDLVSGSRRANNTRRESEGERDTRKDRVKTILSQKEERAKAMQSQEAEERSDSELLGEI